jgi:hypothetical protein
MPVGVTCRTVDCAGEVIVVGEKPVSVGIGDGIVGVEQAGSITVHSITTSNLISIFFSPVYGLSGGLQRIILNSSIIPCT